MTTKQTAPDLVAEVEELLAKFPANGVSLPKPSPSQRGALNEYSCGCQARRDAAGAVLIHACAIHNAAPDLLRRLVDEVKRLRLQVEVQTEAHIRNVLVSEDEPS